MKGKFNQDRYFGVEIEFLAPVEYTHNMIATKLTANGVDCRQVGYTHRTTPYWKIVSDTSVQSHKASHRGSNELVSPKLKGLEGLAEVKKVCDMLNDLGCEVNKTCGLHIHQDVTHIVDEDKNAVRFLKNLVIWVSKFEHIIYRLISPSRLKTGFSQPIRKLFYNFDTGYGMVTTRFNKTTERMIKGVNLKSITKKIKSCVRVKSANTQIQSNRYAGLNLFKVWERGSVEFRYHNGTICFDKMANWIVLTQAIINIVGKKSYVAMSSVPNGLKGLAMFRKALGFTETDKDEVIKSANKYTIKRFRALSKKRADYRTAGDYGFVANGLFSNREEN